MDTFLRSFKAIQHSKLSKYSDEFITNLSSRMHYNFIYKNSEICILNIAMFLIYFGGIAYNIEFLKT